MRQVYHDANNQLSLVIGYAEVLAVDPALPDYVREAVGEILRGAEGVVTALSRLQLADS